MKTITQKELKEKARSGSTILDKEGKKVRLPELLRRPQFEEIKPDPLTAAVESLVNQFQAAMVQSSKEIAISHDIIKGISTIMQETKKNSTDGMKKIQDIAKQFASIAKSMQNQTVTVQLEKGEPEERKPRSWRFQIKRNPYDNDLISEIIAKEET